MEMVINTVFNTVIMYRAGVYNEKEVPSIIGDRYTSEKSELPAYIIVKAALQI